jgi:hypothetical protein
MLANCARFGKWGILGIQNAPYDYIISGIGFDQLSFTELIDGLALGSKDEVERSILPDMSVQGASHLRQ